MLLSCRRAYQSVAVRGAWRLDSVRQLTEHKVYAFAPSLTLVQTWVYIPVEHDPLSDGYDTILCLVERGQLGLDRVVRVRHCAL